MFYVYSSLGLAVPPRVRFLQKWKKAKEAKKKEREALGQTMVEDLNEKLNKSSDSEVSEDEQELNRPSLKDTYNSEPYRPSSKDTYDFHNGKLIFINFKIN